MHVQLESQKVALIGDRVFADVIIKGWSYWIGMVLNVISLVSPYTETHTQRKEMEREIAEMQPQAKENQELPEETRRRSSLGNFRGSLDLLTS